MTILLIYPDCQNLSITETDKIFTDFFKAIEYEKETGFVSRMSAHRVDGDIVYLPAPSEKLESEKQADRMIEEGCCREER